MCLFPVKKYLGYLMFSRHWKGYGIHSPFVFELVSVALRNKIEPDIVCCIENIRRKMTLSRKVIAVNDMGSGSRKIKTSLRKVSDIARYSAVSKKYGIFLSRMSKAFAGPLVIEFGTSLGISTMYLAASCGESRVYTIEGCRTTSKIASDNFSEAGLTNIRIFNGSFDEILPEIIREKTSPGLVFIDGDHRKEAVVRYFSKVVEISDNKTVVIIDDINSTKEMAEAWKQIKNHNKVTFTIDIYRMGIAFFRDGMNRFNYVIRY